jgi:putative Holliday junction resolvase
MSNGNDIASHLFCQVKHRFYFLKGCFIKAILFLMSDNNKKRVLGLDVGKKRIGVALTDESFLIAQPLKVINRVSLKEDIAAIIVEVTSNNVGSIVIGMPYQMNGKEGPAAAYVRRFTSELEAALGAEPAIGTVEIEFWDERFSTAVVERVLIQGDARRSKRKQVVDKLAAAYILQGWMDAKANKDNERER